MFTSPSEQGTSEQEAATSEQGACANSEPVTKEWVTEQLEKMEKKISETVKTDVFELLTRDVLNIIIQTAIDQVKNIVSDTYARNNAEDEKSNDKNTGSSEAESVKIPNVLENEHELTHFGVVCDNCDCQISGIRYKCRDCKDFDLCEVCENILGVHDEKHVFLKIRYPIPVCPYMKKQYLKEKKQYRALKSDESEPENLSLPICKIKNPPKTLNHKELAFKFIGHETVPHSTVFSPGEKFIKMWRVKNLSVCDWNSYTTIRMTYSDNLFQPLHTEVVAPKIGPLQEGTISVSFTAPKYAGYYLSIWRFHHMDVPFGDPLRCKIIVENDPDFKNAFPIEPPVQAMRFCEYIPQQKHKRKCCKDEKRKKEKRKVKHALEAWSLAHAGEPNNTTLFPKMYMTSHTATPNNTPFDLTPPKSPEPETKKRNSVPTLTEAIASSTSSLKMDPDLHSKPHKVMISSSSESDSEFVVIPMPKCYDLSEPFKSENLDASVEVASIDRFIDINLPRNIVETESYHKSSDNMSEETGVPETCYVASNARCFCSSSSVSVIDSPIPVISEVKDEPIQVIQQVTEPLIDIESDNASSGTFPKFPVADIDSEQTFTESISSQNDEKTIQVLPEGLVTGALLAAATVYNTARGIISSIQPGKNDQEGLSEGLPTPVVEQPPQRLILSPVQQLVEMGFCNIERNEYLLRKYKNNVVKVIEELINMSDEDWNSSRQQ